MQYLFLLVFLYFLLKDFRKGVVIYAPFKFFFYEGFKLGPTSFDIALSTIVCAIFFIKKRKLIIENFPWKKSFGILLISGVIFSFYPSFYIGEFLRQVFCIYGYGFVFFYSLSDKSITNTFLKSCTLFAILLAGNGFFQLVTDQNLLGNFHDSFYNAGFTDNSLVRFGNFSRIRSFCSHSISYGVECVVFLITFLYMYFGYKKEYFAKSMYFAIFFCVIGIITSGSRTPLLGVAIMILPLMTKLNRISGSQKLIVILAIICFCALFGLYVIEMINSIINPDKTSVEGSNTTGRLEQFAYSIYLVQNNWLLGYGNVNIMDMKSFDYSILYGAESIWMVTILQKGIIGILAYAYFYVDIFKHLPKNNKTIFIFFVLGWLLIDSATSLMGINMFLPIMIMSLLYRLGTNNNLIKYDSFKYNNSCL